MKYLLLLIFPVILFSCSQDENQGIEGKFEFVSEYRASITVGGILGTKEQTFEVGEIYKGVDLGEDSITIRIAEHTKRNEDCPSNLCYQEFLDVPRFHLKLAN